MGEETKPVVGEGGLSTFLYSAFCTILQCRIYRGSLTSSLLAPGVAVNFPLALSSIFWRYNDILLTR